MTDEIRLAKVEFRVESESGKIDVETLWAESLGGHKYRLDNIPFFAFGVSWQDLIEAVKDAPEDFPIFRRVVEKSGNKTVRVVFELPVEDGNESDLTLKQLIQMGCSYEGGSRKYIAINIPKDVDLWEVGKFLTSSNLQWEHADPTYEELHPG